MAGLFDDLIPGDKKGLSFADLITQAPPPDVGNQPIDASTVFTDEMLFGLPGKASAGINALVRAPFTDKSIGEEYDTLRNQYQNARKQYAQQHPVANAASSIAGSVYGGAVTGGAAGNLIGRGAQALGRAAPYLERPLQAVGQTLRSTYGGRMAADAAAGATQGGLSAYGHDEDIGAGAALGGLIGGAARPVIDAGGAALGSLAGLVGVGNQARANSAITAAMTRANMTTDDVAKALSDAAAAGQPYTVADALGNAGQRMLTGIARSPGDMRQTIAETLQGRQMDQGGRVASFLQDASGSPLTADQYEKMLAARRAADAEVNYRPVQTDPTAIDVSNPVSIANRTISPAADTVANSIGLVPTDLAGRGAMESGEASIRDPIRQAVKEARSYLASDTNTVTNVAKAFRAKTNIDQMINDATQNGKGATVDALLPIQKSLDDALANTSSEYASARDAYRNASQPIDAIATGRQMASPKTRIADNISTFYALPSDEARQAARVGYFNPLVASAENKAGTMSNAARPFTSNSARQELPLMAAPGEGPRLMDRLQREQQMFETMNAALGGSRTADNAADIADVQGFDPTIIGAFATGGLKGAILHGLARGTNTVQGRNKATRDAIAQFLLQGDAGQVRSGLTGAIAQRTQSERLRDEVVRALIGGGATALPKIQAYQ